MKFGYTIIYVSNVSETLSFYEKAFGFPKRFVTEDNLYGELETGETTLSFASYEMAQRNGVEINKTKNHLSPAELAFVTENVNQAMEKAIAQGATLLKKSERKPWGQDVGYVKDLNGFIIEICTPMKA